MKTVIVAAGMGSRLWNETNHVPKTLMPFGKGTILSTIMNNFSQVGMNDFVIVIGYNSEHILKYLKENNNLSYNISFVENNKWEKGNGISVLASEKEIGEENFILSMSDHIVSTSALNRIITSKSDKNLLLIDPKVNDIFDIDDGTKVEVQETRITNIGKELENYNGIDCGIFRLTTRFYTSMREQLKLNKDSISASITGLIKNNDMDAIFMKDDDYWIDIDTPEAYRHAIKNYNDKY